MPRLTSLVAAGAPTTGASGASRLGGGLRLDVALGGTREGLLDRLHRARRLVILLVIAWRERGGEVSGGVDVKPALGTEDCSPGRNGLGGGTSTDVPRRAKRFWS